MPMYLAIHIESKMIIFYKRTAARFQDFFFLVNVFDRKMAVLL